MEPDVRTIADLPFHVMGRFQTAPVVGSARGGELHSVTGKAFFDGIREISLGLDRARHGRRRAGRDHRPRAGPNG